MRRVFLLQVCLALSLSAQYPPETQWRKIVTPHFEVIFPQEIERDAERAANALETLYAPLTRTLGASLPRHTTVLLPNQDVTRYSGGSVSLFPRLATFNMMPAQGFWGANDWINTLTANETRQLVQIAKMNHGFGKLAYIVFGEAGLASTMAVTLPDWWAAGDARVAETSTLRGGIGQFASSEQVERALLLSDQHYSYMKAMHGSYRDLVPSQDELGAFLVSHVDRTSGSDAWNRIMTDTARQSWNPFALTLAMKKETGRTASTNYHDTISELGELWKSKTEPAEVSQPHILNSTVKSSVTGYYQPVYEADGSVLAQKIGQDTFPVEVVRVSPDGTEQRLFRAAPSVAGTNRTSVVAGRMVWDEFVPDPRWLRGYSEIVIRDLATGRTRKLTHKTRFMNPVLSPDGKRVAVVEFLPTRVCSLFVLDADKGSPLRRLPSPDNDMIYSPAWSEDGRRLAMVTHSPAGRALTVLALESGTFTDVIPHSNEELANPAFFRNYVLYKSSGNGVVNIYAVEISSGRRYRVTSSKFGADFPSISSDGTKLLYSDFSTTGYNLAELPLDPVAWTPVTPAASSSLGYLGTSHDYSAEIPATSYPIAPYHPSSHLFDVHSWGPTWFPPEVGYGVISNDKMGLVSSNASFIYNTNERAPGFTTGVSYSGFYPVLDFGFSDRERRLQFVNQIDNFSERTASAGFHIPLNLSRGYTDTFLSVGTNVQSIDRQGGGLVPLSWNFGLYHARQFSARDLAPPWGQMLNLTYNHTLEQDHYRGNFLSADGHFALPGLLRHHKIILESGYEHQVGNYFYSSQILFPRGYTAVVGSNLTKLSANYGLPLFYPDWAMGQILYIKRISANTFYDYGRVAERLYRSTGVETVFDFNVYHFSPTFQAGVRYAERLDYHNSRIQPFLSYGW